METAIFLLFAANGKQKTEILFPCSTNVPVVNVPDEDGWSC
jgi:hypothetical protein